MDRTYLSTYITGQFASLIAAAGVSATDDTGDYGPALDSVMRMLGLDVQVTASNPTVPAPQESDALLLTRYYALLWLQQAFAASADFGTPDVKDAGSQRFKQVTLLLDNARKQVPPQYPIEAGDFSLGRLNLDLFEPGVFLGNR